MRSSQNLTSHNLRCLQSAAWRNIAADHDAHENHSAFTDHDLRQHDGTRSNERARADDHLPGDDHPGSIEANSPRDRWWREQPRLTNANDPISEHAPIVHPALRKAPSPIVIRAGKI